MWDTLLQNVSFTSGVGNIGLLVVYKGKQVLLAPKVSVYNVWYDC